MSHAPMPERPDVRLVVVDMDGTLLDGDGQVPDGLWPLLDRMREAGVVFAPASGRQYATLAAMFARAAEGMVFIAENGGYVVRDDEEVSAATLPVSLVTDVVRRMRALADDGTDLGVVVCGRRTAYVERHDRAFLDHVDPYYASLTEVDDLLAVDDTAVKVAVFAFGDPTERVEPALAPLRPDHQVVVSGAHWVDVMDAAVHKGVAVRRLQETLGVTAAQTAAFGDYLNDLEMLDEAELSFAMDNAHPDVLDRARHRAPANTEDGVVRTVTALLDRA
ncbi:Cof-type HAD-IIB family hydrolase [Nocardioides sp. AX2bis]|uniref:Cof-type HAD-IIB family hydrolase n=1 Tax=Nocardioides sp. AX2bis TaxID=2653157 RepID=UPI001916131B|nr:Cof-type HAD-IIB family hydrolase [Nocardioides sp. AX2bis]